MTLGQQLLDVLRSHTVPVPGLVCAQADGGTTVALQVADLDRLSCSFSELQLAAARIESLDAAELKAWADDVCRRVTYLLENLRPLEIDAERQAALVRSAAPEQLPAEKRYYEVSLTAPGQVTLHRYRRAAGSDAREPIDMAATLELTRKLVDDLVASLPA